MRLTRRELVAGGAAAGALAGGGIYALVDRLTGSKPARPEGGERPPEQHLLLGERLVEDNGVEVVVPPLHHAVLTAELDVADRKSELLRAQRALEETLSGLERRFEASAAGLGVTVAWGLPYFRRYVPELAERHLPVDRRASKEKSRPVPALIDAIRFPSDPLETVLEQNDLAILLRSDHLEHVEIAGRMLRELDFLRLTSVRRGFAGGGFAGGKSLPKRMAVAAGVPGADLIPDSAELFLGFTSTQRAGLGPPRIANLETLGYADGGPEGYFLHGTHMHLSHLFEDLEAWYLVFDHADRVATTFRPGLDVPAGTLTVPQGPEDCADPDAVRRDYREAGTIGHSASIQPASRLQRDIVGTDGAVYPKGTAVPQRADFNTLDNPFAFSARPDVDGWSPDPAAGLHFVVFNPTSDDFHRTRLAMDGVLPDGTRLFFAPRSRGQGFNSVLQTTHRQNFLVPPRRHRSFPLVELIR